MSILKDTVIEILNTSNYDVWKFRLEKHLQKDDLYSAISQDPPDPMTDEFRNKNRKARAIINLLIDDDQIINVKNLESERECWLALKEVHERTNLSSKLFLLRRLYSIKLLEGGNIVDHLTKIYPTRDKLQAIGENISDQHTAANNLRFSVP